MSEAHDSKDGAIPEVDTAVESVTVYSDRARVRRAGTAPVVQGRQRIAVGPLPAGLIDGSVSASVDGDAGVRLLSLQVDRSFGRRVERQDAAELLERQQKLQREIAALDEEMSELGDEQGFLEALPVEPEPDDNDNPRPVALEPETWASTLAFVGDRVADLRFRIRTAERRRKERQEQLSDVQLRLRSLDTYESDERKQVLLEVQAPGPGTATLEVTYTLAGPRWRPSYDLHVDAAAGRLELHGYGVVCQSTGEDWSGTILRLSTAAPQVGAELPRLLAWRLGDTSQHRQGVADGVAGEMDAGDAVMASTAAPPPPAPAAPMPMAEMAMEAPAAGARPAPRRARKSVSRSMKRKEALMDEMAEVEEVASFCMDEDDEMEWEPPPPPPSQRAQRSAPRPAILPMGKGTWSLPAGEELTFQPHAGGLSGGVRQVRCPTPQHAAGGFDFVHTAEGPQDVPSNGREHRIPLGVRELPCDLLHEVVAPLEQRAYLRAVVTNDRDRPLLAGESFVFLDGGFVARAFVDTVAPRGDLDLVLGIDEDLKVERQVEQTTATTGLLSKKDRTVYRIDLSVRSYKERPVRLRLRDQVPITWQEDDIEIETLEIHPRPDDKPDQGMMVWTRDLEPGGKASVQLQYSVERPRDFELITERGTP